MPVADSIIGRRIGHWTVLRCTAELSTLLCRCVCGRVYAIVSDIPVMLVEEALPAEARLI